MERIQLTYADFAITALIFDQVFVESLRRKTVNDLTRDDVQQLCAQKKRAIGVKDLARKLRIPRHQAYGRLHRAAVTGTIKQANKPEKTNRKLYVASSPPHFVPDPEKLFQKLKLRGPVRFVHPITGETIEYRRKKPSARR